MDNRAVLEQPSYTLFRQAYAERKAPLVIVCGSGLSSSAKLPTWSKLRDSLIREAENKRRVAGAIGQELLLPKLEAIKRQADYWVAFKLLKEFLGKPLFDSLIERELTAPDDVNIPEPYLQLLRLSPSGLVTLNLDKFAGEALSQTQNVPITPIYGTELARKWNALRAAKTFLVYLHGGLHDPATWVMTQDDLDRVYETEGHSLFLKTLFADYLVLFAGISADDIALSARLIQLTNSGFQPKNLYWLTTRSEQVEEWANNTYVKLISYSARTDSDHSDTIREIVEDCMKFKSVDRPEPPIIRPVDMFAQLGDTDSIDPDELAQKPPEEVRHTISKILNERLSDLSEHEDVFRKYREFCEEFDFAVDRAFYRGRQDKYRKWFGYMLDQAPLGRGNFGEVYSAQSPDGKLVAVKIMHKNIFNNDDMLAGFRRGVRSMGIVTKQSIKGMVPILDSFELPPTIVMPYVPGVSLEDAVRSGSNIPWLTKLDVAIAIGQAVGLAHALPQTVLHRDMKPSNIMISNMEYAGSFSPEVVVLDFDMSWHKGSKEKDVVFESRDDFGYLAPEQTDKSNVYSARSTRVDSYGFGMTLFFLFGHEAPRPNEALSDHWQKRATHAMRGEYGHSWKSAPYRLGRLVSRATMIEQNLRVDFATMTHELEFVRQAVTDPEHLDSPELWAEEVLSHVGGDVDYEWDDALGKGKIERSSGIRAEVITNFRSDVVMLLLGFTDQGFSDRARLSKYLVTAVDTADRFLRESGWIVTERSSGQQAFIRAEASIQLLQSGREKVLSGATDALRAFQL